MVDHSAARHVLRRWRVRPQRWLRAFDDDPAEHHSGSHIAGGLLMWIGAGMTPGGNDVLVLNRCSQLMPSLPIWP
jgi:hypothetical protein